MAAGTSELHKKQDTVDFATSLKMPDAAKNKHLYNKHIIEVHQSSFTQVLVY